MTANNTNKTVLITGATRGIGLELAKQYKQNGWNVIGAARNLNNADKLKAVAPYKIVQIDTSDEATILQAAQELQGETINLLINNAGIADVDNFESASKESMLRQFEVNTIGPFLVTRAFAPQLRAAVAKDGSATVAHVSSTMGSITANDGVRFGTGFYGYRTAKTGLNMINSCLALDLKKDKIISVSFCPGYVATDMNGHAGPLSVDESVAGLSKVIAGLQEEDSGSFLSYDGSKLAW